MYGENTKYHVNPYIQGTTVPCDNKLLHLHILYYAYGLRKGNKINGKPGQYPCYYTQDEVWFETEEKHKHT